MQESLKDLADKLGIVIKYSDAGLSAKDYVVDEKTVKFFAEEMGYKAGDEKEINASLRKFEQKRWQRVLEPIYTNVRGSVVFDVVIVDKESEFSLELKNKQTGIKEAVSFVVNIGGEKKSIAKTRYVKATVEVCGDLKIGYYEAEFGVDGEVFKTVLAVAPKECYRPDVLDEKKLWGYAVQLYSLRSKTNWGIGDFADLRKLVAVCAEMGADVIGLNPLNVLGHSFPEEASPYSSVSRLFLNPIYIAVEDVPEFEQEDTRAYVEEISSVRASKTIDYGKVYPLKMKVLEKLYQKMKSNPKRLGEFDEFCSQKGLDLENLATFISLYDDKWKDYWGGWHAWEKDLQNPNSLAVKKYKKDNVDKVGFLKFLQFEAERQLSLVSAQVADKGLKIGLYRDLAVGVGRDSAEVWSDEGLFFKRSGAGAPPDAFFPAGQKWNLGAFNPMEIKERAYEPFIKIIRSAAAGAGALRLDHVMFLMRLFVIPEAKGAEGTYISYNFEDMLNIVAIESCLNRCMIVGESIGNVPDGFLEQLKQRNIYAMSVLWSERWDAGWGDFLAPCQMEEKVFTSVGTHDMSPLKMWWFAHDITLSRQLGIIPDDASMHGAYHKREADRWKLLKAMDENCVWPLDNPRKGNYLFGEAYPEGLEEAVHTYMAKSNAKVFMLQPEDVLQVDELQNLPGTDRDKHANWRKKLPLDVEDFLTDIRFIRNVAAVKRGR